MYVCISYGKPLHTLVIEICRIHPPYLRQIAITDFGIHYNDILMHI